MRFIFGRELSSPMRPSGLCSTLRRWKKLFYAASSVFSCALDFVLVFLLCSYWMAFKGTRSRAFPQSISFPYRLVSLTVCKNFICSSCHVSNCHNTEEYSECTDALLLTILCQESSCFLLPVRKTKGWTELRGAN